MPVLFIWSEESFWNSWGLYLKRFRSYCIVLFLLTLPPPWKPVSHRAIQSAIQPSCFLSWMSWVRPWNWKRFAESYTECLSGTTKSKEVWPEKIELGLTKLFQKKSKQTWDHEKKRVPPMECHIYANNPLSEDILFQYPLWIIMYFLVHQSLNITYLYQKYLFSSFHTNFRTGKKTSFWFFANFLFLFRSIFEMTGISWRKKLEVKSTKAFNNPLFFSNISFGWCTQLLIKGSLQNERKTSFYILNQKIFSKKNNGFSFK